MLEKILVFIRIFIFSRNKNIIEKIIIRNFNYKSLKDIQEKQDELLHPLKAAQALHAGTIQEHIESKIEKKGFWHWFFRKRN